MQPFIINRGENWKLGFIKETSQQCMALSGILTTESLTLQWLHVLNFMDIGLLTWSY